MNQKTMFKQQQHVDISIIIPCHNLERYIEKCLNSILNQNYDSSAYEIIVVIDSCTDKTASIVKSMLQDKINHKVLYANCRRPGLARNIGLEVATGNYVWFIDGDDYIINDRAFERLKNTISLYNANVVYMRNFESDMPVRDEFAAWHYFYKRELIDLERFGDGVIDSDWDFTKKLSKKADYNVISILDNLYHYTFPRKGSVVTEFLKQSHQKGKQRN